MAMNSGKCGYISLLGKKGPALQINQCSWCGDRLSVVISTVVPCSAKPDDPVAVTIPGMYLSYGRIECIDWIIDMNFSTIQANLDIIVEKPMPAPGSGVEPPQGMLVKYVSTADWEMEAIGHAPSREVNRIKPKPATEVLPLDGKRMIRLED